ncbi:MAG: uracil-DNA glycosylase family protein [Planctomycetota bacterium]
MASSRKSSLDALLGRIRRCTICEPHLPHGVRPVVRAQESARILVAGQAPGRRVHESGVPFDDPSGDRLREWMGVDRKTFYDEKKIAIVPMGFCYPGTGKSGDLPPRPECAETWHDDLLGRLPNIELTLVIGAYAMRWHLESAEKNLTETVRNWKRYRPTRIPLPHPSPRNNIWMRRNPWFATDVLPYVRRRVAKLLQG